MRSGMDPAWQAALEAAGITTAWAARLDFAAETVGVWTGPYSIQPTATGDTLLDGVQFDSLANGVVVQFGDNSFTYDGSDELDIVLGIPSNVSAEITAANALPAEWRTRPVTIWRCLLSRPSNPLGEPTWMFRRVRTGSMDQVMWSEDGTQINFKLTVESHASLISNASNMTYMNQHVIDPNDASQNFVVAIANGDSLSNATNTVSPTNSLINSRLGTLLP